MVTKKVVEKSKKSKPIGKGVPKGGKPLAAPFFLKSTTFFLTYKGISDSGEKLTKNQLANYLVNQCSTTKLKPQKYLICEQMYDSGQPHFHAIIIYSTRKQITKPNYYDFMGIHPNIQTMRNMKAALAYVYKQDPNPVTNMDVAQQRRVARARYSSSLYELLEEQMLKDPLHFNLDQYLFQNNLFKQVYKANYAKAITLFKRAHPIAARAHLRATKKGIKLITPQLIDQRLTPEQKAQYYSQYCYQRIVHHINQIHKYPNINESTKAPKKTRHLLLTGLADIGKSGLINHEADEKDQYPGLEHYYPTYYMSAGQKFYPPYDSFIYSLVNWEQFTIASEIFPKSGYNRLLNYLDGAVSHLPQKGRPAATRNDNPKHILTSNRTLIRHIHKTFNVESARQEALNNLPARIENVTIPKGKNIHFLRKLFVPKD